MSYVYIIISPITSFTSHSYHNIQQQGGMLALPAGLAAGAGTGYLPAYLLLGFSV